MNGSQASARVLGSVLDRLAKDEPAALERLFRLLAIPSVSTDPAHHEACIEAAECCAQTLSEIGFAARVEPTLGKPMVVGHWRAKARERASLRVLFYTCSRPTRWRNGARRPSPRVCPRIRATARSSSPAAPPTTKAS